MMLNNTTINVLKAADIEVLGSNDGPSNSIRRFICPLTLKPDGGFVPVESDFKLSVLVERNDLARHIISNVRNKIPESINFNFEMSCIGIDLAKREVSFQHQDTKIVTRNYDLLVGADGSSSEIRRAMEQQIDSLRSSSMLNLDYHKSFVDIVVKEDTVPNNYKKMLELGVITFYRRLKKFGNSMPIKRMSFTIGSKGRLFGNFIGTVSGFDSIKGKEKEYLNTVLPKDFPQDWIDQMIPQLRDNTLYRMPSVIELSTFIGPNVVLIGDAGHGVSPRLGMGCNMAIQDSQILHDALESAKGDINQALKTYNDIRYSEVARIQQLEKIISAETYKQEGINKLLPFLVNLHFSFSIFGNGYVPWLIPRSAFLRCTLEDITSTEAIRILKFELGILIVLATTMTSVLFNAMFRLL